MSEKTKSETRTNAKATRRGVLKASSGAVVLQSSIFDSWWPFDDTEPSNDDTSNDDTTSTDGVINIRANGTEVSNPVDIEFGSGVSASIDDSGDNPVVTITSSGSSGDGFDFGTIT